MRLAGQKPSAPARIRADPDLEPPMRLTPTERDRLLIFTAAELARARRARGLRLNVPEATALIADTVCEAARDGRRLAEAVEAGRVRADRRRRAARRPGHRHRDPGRGGLRRRHPAGRGRPTRSAAAARSATEAPGAALPRPAGIDAAAAAAVPPPAAVLPVVNTGIRADHGHRHFHFFEVNPRLAFDRARAYGLRLAIPAGSSTRFDPGVPVEVALVPIGGARIAIGFSGLVDGPLDAPGAREPPRPGRATGRGIRDAVRAERRNPAHDALDPRDYIAVHGPRAGDRVRLGDTGLVVEVEADSQQPGDEFLVGFGKTARDGLLPQGRRRPRHLRRRHQQRADP